MDCNEKISDRLIIIFILIISIILGSASYLLFESIESEENLYEASLIEVVDGDTLWVKVDGEELKVRLIGVNAPESVHTDAEQNSEYGTMASDFTKDFFENYTTVYLQYDEERQDQYGRELCYVWINDDVDVDVPQDISTYMFNSILLQEGYAADAAYEPNTTYADYFKKVCSTARAKQVGLWKYINFL